MNIIVKTRLDTEENFEEKNPILFPGEIAISSNRTIAINNDDIKESQIKIGNGKSRWKDSASVILPEEIISKWEKIAKEATNSQLITLPDLNFAYTTINTDSKAVIEDIVGTVIFNQNYLLIKEDSEYNQLIFSGAELQDIKFDNDKQEIININQLVLQKNGDEAGRIYNLRDKQNSEEISFLKDSYKIIDSNVTELESNIGELSKSILDFENLLPPQPTDEQKDGDYFLKASGEWTKINFNFNLYGNNIKMSEDEDAKTIAEAIQEAASTGGNQLTIDDIANSSQNKNYVTTVISKSDTAIRYVTSVYIDKSSGVLFGAAYNDYAEARETNNIAAGRVVVENGDDTLSLSSDRLMLGGNIVSDTYGMLIGETDKAKTPIALCGRVLAYPLENKQEYYPGAPVCTGPNGTVSLMSKDEVLHYPECIIGYVSAIPNYEEWNGVKVNDRIWIKVV